LAATLGASARSVAEGTVLISMNSLPATLPESRPSLPLYTASIAALSVSIVITVSQWPASSAGVAAGFAPLSVRGLVLATERFHAWISCP
jgi:hypothetical protein